MTLTTANLGGLSVDAETREDGSILVRVPAEPFHVNAGAPGYGMGSQGPFEPESSPEELDFVLERYGYIRGRVVADGAPVANARLHGHYAPPFGKVARFRDELFTTLGTGPALVHDADADGYFEIPRVSRMPVTLHAEAPGFARAQSEALDAPLVESIEGVVLELPRPATLFGRVLVAAGVDVQGTIVGITRGDGHVQTKAVGADGVFRFERLPPGCYQVKRCMPEHQGDMRGRRLWPANDVDELPCDVEVAAGEAVELDLDLTSELPCSVVGSLTIDGEPAESWQISMWCEGQILEARTDATGRFELACRKAGEAYLTLTSGSVDPQVLLREPLTLVPGANAWDRSLTTGTVELGGLPAAEPSDPPGIPGFALAWFAEGSKLSWMVMFDGDAEGARTIDGVPVGPVELREAARCLEVRPLDLAGRRRARGARGRAVRLRVSRERRVKRGPSGRGETIRGSSGPPRSVRPFRKYEPREESCLTLAGWPPLPPSRSS